MDWNLQRTKSNAEATAVADSFQHSAGPDLESILDMYARPVESVLTLRPEHHLRVA